MPHKWNAEAQAKLLTGILTVLEIKMNQEGLERLADYMGPNYSANGVRQQIIKVKASVNAANISPSKDTLSASAGEKKSTPKKRNKLPSYLDYSDKDDDEEFLPRTPSKRAKKQTSASALKARKSIKQAEEDEVEDDNAEEHEDKEAAMDDGGEGPSTGMGTRIKMEPDDEDDFELGAMTAGGRAIVEFPGFGGANAGSDFLDFGFGSAGSGFTGFAATNDDADFGGGNGFGAGNMGFNGDMRSNANAGFDPNMGYDPGNGSGLGDFDFDDLRFTGL
ncbi:hypothetical protein K490DRAFT_59028 [Saccharata proteae CBS 121410]|uniref:Uncharacterized protein n=1 Tax=Saccharata proteae CBS 121410 TaxID=1314787 RepID=A0A9P4HNY5_9PEZI|nr:hypothetical protein K490DRAFT_59028 [Saccharata proteae CBS 121410]